MEPGERAVEYTVLSLYYGLLQKEGEYMSNILDEMEKTASVERIEDHEKIGQILDRFLDMSLEEFVGNDERFTYLGRDISQGFDLDQEKVEKLSLRDILILIGYEPGFPWFELPEDDTWFYDNEPTRKFFSAGHCFFLARVIRDSASSNPVLKQFMHMDYWKFIKYLSDRMVEMTDDHNGNQREICRKGMKLNRLYSITDKFTREYSSVEGYISMGDVINTACCVGLRCWICGTEPLNIFMKKTQSAYNTMRILFMDCMRMSLIKSDRDSFRFLLDTCSESGLYDEDCYSEIDFNDCYE